MRDNSVRLLIGSGALSNRINGRLDGDTLELAIPQDTGTQNRRLTPASRDDYARAVQDIRDHEQQRKDATQTRTAREQRAAKTAITRVATAFQQALDPHSPDDPCRYLTPQLKQAILSLAESGNPGVADRGCTAVIRDSERHRGQQRQPDRNLGELPGAVALARGFW